jgi:DNA invertase Pin-like site-specific DNA recombinase
LQRLPLRVGKIAWVTGSHPFNLSHIRPFAHFQNTLLGRSLKQLIETVTMLAERGIELRSLKENIDTTTPTGKLLFHIIGAMAEFERDVISERTQAGLEAARARGRRGGRPKAIEKIEPRNLARAKALYAAKNNTVQEIMQMTGFKSRNTFYKYVVNGDASNP